LKRRCAGCLMRQKARRTERRGASMQWMRLSPASPPPFPPFLRLVSCWPTTTRICASMWGGCSPRITRSKPSQMARPHCKRRANARQTDLVLSDVMMRNLDGFGLLKALREDERLGTISVILLSARAGEEARVEGMEAGADDYLIKPFSARELLARVRAHLEMTRLR